MHAKHPLSLIVRLAGLALLVGFAALAVSTSGRTPGPSATREEGWAPAESAIHDLDGGESEVDRGEDRQLADVGPYRAFAPLLASDEPRATAPVRIALFKKPFSGEYRASNFLDHDVPKEFVDTNGRFVTYWGERMRVNIDGHSGYDWLLAEGTPVYAAATGRVVVAGDGAPFVCPILNNQTVIVKSVTIQHVVEVDGTPVNIQSLYLHLSQVDVQVGQQVSQGDQIGLSGNTGCSTGPHLHFEVRRQVKPSNRYVQIDPYGWEGSEADPWAKTPEGAASLWLWDEAPLVYGESRLNGLALGNAKVDIAGVRWIGYRDDLNPNNEFVEFALDPRFTTVANDLTGFLVKNNRDETYTFPAGFQILPDRPVRLYSGSGTDTATSLYWGRSSGVWDNLGSECARLVSPQNGTFRYTIGGTCR